MCAAWVARALPWHQQKSGYATAWVSAVQAGALFALFFAWNVSQMFEELEAK